MASTSNSIITRRRHDLDNLKTCLTGLVVAHHAAIPYGGAGNWPFRSQLFPPGFQFTALLCFNAVNQSFFMGLFFWVSGRMSAQSLNRPGMTSTVFLRTKLVRLGIPTLLNTVFGPPLVTCLAQGRLDSIFTEYWRQLRGVRGVTWYMATLLVFDMVAAACHLVLPPRGALQIREATTGASIVLQ